MSKKEKIKTYTMFLGVFFLIAIPLFCFFYLQGNSMVNNVADGFRQHYRAYLYYSDYLKQIFHNLFNSFRLVIPQWDFSLGEGSDVLQTLHYYCIGDPIAFLCVFFNEENMYLFYDFGIILRIMLSGLAFVYLCIDTGINNKYGIVAGALVYCYSLYIVTNIIMHPFFLNPTIYLPLIICGVERVFNKQRPFLLIISVCFAALSNIYFFYVIALLTFVYSIVRVCITKIAINNKIIEIIKIGMYSLLGVVMAGIIILPMMYSLLNNARVFANNNVEWFYDYSYYLSLINTIVLGNDYFGGFTIIGLFAFIIMFIKRDNKLLLYLFVIGIIFSCSPFFGSIFNGMSYSNRRWMFGLSLLCSYIIAYYFEELPKLSKKWVYCVAFLYYALCVVIDPEEFRIYLLYLLATIVFLLANQINKNTRLKNLLCLSAVLFFVMFDIVYKFSPIWWNRASLGAAIEKLQNIKNDETAIAMSIDDDSFWRYSGNSLEVNSSIHTGHSSTNFYWSIDNGDIATFRKDLGLLDHSTHHYDDDNYRFSVLAIDSVKYYIKDKNKGQLPYGYKYISSNGDYELYENDLFVPLMSFYDNYILYDDWKELNILTRQETMTKSVVLFEKSNVIPEIQVSNSFEVVPSEIIASEQVVLDNNLIRINETNSKITIDAVYEKTGEYYLVINNLDSKTDSKWEVESTNVREIVNFKSSNNPAYSNRHDFVINLGYKDNLNDTITIMFPDVGEYTFDSIEVLYLPVDQQVLGLQELKEKGIRSIDFDNNNIETNISLSTPSFMYMSIPFNIGWKAYDNGVETNIVKSNVGYMGIQLPSGNHHIELKYSTPLLKEGLIVSLLGLLGFMCLFVYMNNANKR